MISGKSLAIHPEEAAHYGLDNYAQPLSLPFELPTRVYGAMLAVWLLKPVLQRRFPLYRNRQIDYLRFLAWCAHIGRRDYAILRELDQWNRELERPAELPELKKDRWSGSFTVGMYLIGIARSRYWAAPMLTSARIRHQVARWYWRDGRHQVGLSGKVDWQFERLVRLFRTPENLCHSLAIKKDRTQTDSAQRLRDLNADLVRHFATNPKTGRPPIAVPVTKVAGLSRLLGHLAPEYLREALVLRSLFESEPSVEQVLRAVTRISQERQPAALDPGLAFGVNLFGYARGELGIGEDIRMLALSLQSAGVPFCIVNVQPGKEVSQSDRTADEWITDRPKYLFNIFCMTGIEQVRVVCEQGPGILRGRYSIGLWPWELPRWPEPWHHAWNTVNELWGISRYTAQAYNGAPVPVNAMPLPVQLGPVAELGRKDFGLPDSNYLFVFSFDLNSTLTRKNPDAVIEAFQQAFPIDDTAGVGLVIKISHPKSRNAQWKKLKRRITRDRRITLVEGSLRKQDVLALYRSCNCFVSLHRAEGFGRGIAEAQLLGMDVVATGYSGNMDFCTHPATELVDYRLKPLEPGDYFCAEGQEWAEPDIGHAANLMQKVYKARTRSDNARFDTERFQPSHCGDMYKARLMNIFSELKGKGVTLC